MKAAPKYLGRAGGELAKERLSQYVRYAELVADQEAALAVGDLERFEELGALVAELRAQIGPGGAAEDPFGPRRSEAAAAQRILEEALATNRRIQDRLAWLRNDGADRIRSVSQRGPQARRYVADEAETPSTGRIDVKL